MFTKRNIGASSGKSTALTKDAIFALTTYDVVTAVHLMPLWSCWGSHVGLLTDFICFKADAPTIIAARPLHSRNRDNLLMQHGRESPGNACP